MALADRDLSNFGGSPVMLYEFSRHSTPTISGVPVNTYWRYTSADRDYTLGADTYAASVISDDGIRQSGDASTDQLTIEMPSSEAIPQMFSGSPPSDPIYCVIRRTHRDESAAFISWAGLVGAVSRGADDSKASIVCGTKMATLDRTGLRMAWTRLCTHALYDGACKVSPLGFYGTGEVTLLDGAIVIVEEFADFPIGRFTGGWIEWLDSYGHAERRGIIDHGGSAVRVLGTADGLSIGDTAWAFFGCPRTRTACRDIFDNLPRHGGHHYMPDTNPFSGDMIF